MNKFQVKERPDTVMFGDQETSTSDYIAAMYVYGELYDMICNASTLDTMATSGEFCPDYIWVEVWDGCSGKTAEEVAMSAEHKNNLYVDCFIGEDY